MTAGHADGEPGDMVHRSPEPAEARPATSAVRQPVRRSTVVVGRHDDPAEGAADRVATRVIARLRSETAATLTDQRSPQPVRRAMSSTPAAVGAEGGPVDGELARRIRSTAGGRALPDVLRSQLEGAVGVDLSDVRVHQDSDVPARISAEAFTAGRQIHFAPGRFRPDTPTGQELIGHEIAHVAQQGAAPLVRRKLVPKALDAFNAAEAANAKFGTARKDTDDLAREADQTDLTRVHERGYRGGDSDDQKRVAHYVRAVVLSEYSQRLRALESATDEHGQPLSDSRKAAKSVVYKKKAEEFRQKHAPLVAKGLRAPETQTFLREFGFDVGFAPPKPSESKGVARIDVRATFIGAEILGMRMRSHLFIVYTAVDGRQLYFRGGPDDHDNTSADVGEYAPDTVDWDPSAPSVTVLEGPAAVAKLDALIEATRVIDGMQVPYQGVIAKSYGGDNPNALQELAGYVNMGLSKDGENCNATAWTILTRAGVPTAKPSGHHPGWGSILGSKTTGKENALPAAETDAPPMSYTIDESRDITNAAGVVQLYADRMLVEPITKIAGGTKVAMLDETSRYRKIKYAGLTGYIAVKGEDAVYMMAPRWMTSLTDTYDAKNLQIIARRLDDPAALQQVEDHTDIPAQYVPTIVRMVHAPSQMEGLVDYRLGQLGQGRMRDMLNPDELARLAAMTGGDLAAVTKTATDVVTERERVAKVAVSLAKHLKKKNAANMAANEAPDFPTIKAVAAELGEDEPWVRGEIDKLRPPEHQGQTITALLAADTLSRRALPNVPTKTVKAWATATGVSVTFLKSRLAAIHAKNEAEAAEKRRIEKEKAAAAKRERDEERARIAKRQADALAEKQRSDELAAKRSGIRVGPLAPEVEEAVYQSFLAVSKDHEEIWRLLNDVPTLTVVKKIAAQHSLKLTQVAAVAMDHFPNHKGHLLIDMALNTKLDGTVRRALAAGRLPEELVNRIVNGLMSDTGLDEPYIRERLIPVVKTLT